MRLVSYSAGGRTAVGVRRGADIVDAGYADLHALIADGAAGLERAAAAAAAGEPVRDAHLEAPLRPGKILCSGVNYASHADENPNATMPKAKSVCTTMARGRKAFRRSACQRTSRR